MLAEPTDFPPECQRDYSVQCSKSFFPVSTQCWAKPSYSGPCERKQRGMAQMSDEQKESWSIACEDNYPCLPEQCPRGTDWERTCPAGWRHVSGGLCVAPADFDQCDAKVQFAAFSLQDKHAFAQKCGVRWPCRRLSCARDYSSVCPEYWHDEGDSICHANPNIYTGPCPMYANLTGFDNELKENFEIVCFVAWPCASLCERDFSAKCPLAWRLLCPWMYG
ncbi:unnamed protein product [Vitrella brassicaformis CCMP3155]|uniref:CPW-WPC domain-containing protein n=1 Tax=Vitrella brassicaformis (strain CCMP3155) TaxID=1169540 RepID=A0A0G4EE53_VITBC|nr:unnamed protein product [Vitrella brassicaformis CCMP3155]|eukprot:CEL94257.1 unnamed protein product [Vitrella brassicaformis CCMP3155]